MDNLEYTSTWLKALCCETDCSIGGIKLFPLSCWHLFALDSRCNNILDSKNTVNTEDLIDLVLICTHNSSNGIKLIKNESEYLAKFKVISSKLSALPEKELYDICVRYIKEGTKAPDRYQVDSDNVAKAPHVWHIVRVLCNEYNMKLSEAWDTTYITARAYFDVSQEDKGRVNLVSDIDIRATVNAMKEIKALQEAQEQKNGDAR